MNVNEIIKKRIKQVKFHKEERDIIGEQGYSYSSCYLAVLDCPEEVIVDIDLYAKKLHPEWDKRTDNRAEILTRELAGKGIECEIVEFCPPRSYEGKLIAIV